MEVPVNETGLRAISVKPQHRLMGPEASIWKRELLVTPAAQVVHYNNTSNIKHVHKMAAIRWEDSCSSAVVLATAPVDYAVLVLRDDLARAGPNRYLLLASCDLIYTVGNLQKCAILHNNNNNRERLALHYIWAANLYLLNLSQYLKMDFFKCEQKH